MMLLFNGTILFFILMALLLFIFCVRIEKYTAACVIFVVLLFLLFLLYALNEGLPVSHKVYRYKQRISYNNSFFSLHSHNYDLIVKWQDIEAIFLLHLTQSNEEDCHTMEYHIFLNKAPLKITHQKDSNLMFSKDDYPWLIIDNHYNIHFDGFRRMITKYLKEATVENTSIGGIKTIFDRGNNTEDQRLLKYRKNETHTSKTGGTRS